MKEGKKIMGTEGKEHRKTCKIVSEKYNAEEVVVRSNHKIHYFPDLKTKDADFEIEIVPKNLTIKNKIEKWNHERKKILVINVWDYVFSNFDEIFFIDNKNNLQKLK